MQIIRALRRAGHEVTFSFDLNTYLARLSLDKIRRKLNEDERWCCEHHHEPDIVLGRIQPDIAIYCNVTALHTTWQFAGDVIHIVDLCGATHLEALSAWSAGEGPDVSRPSLELVSRQLVEKLRHADYLVTGSERQRHFWLAYCTLAGFGFDRSQVAACPFCLDVTAQPRKLTPEPAVIHAGSFYPWQKPDAILRAAAGLLDNRPGARLRIVGGAHEGLPNADAVHELLAELRTHPSVEYYDFLPVEDLRSLLSSSWVALDLMEWSLERELAVYGRTLEYLTSGTPVIHNEYSSLAQPIREYQAGWTVAPDCSVLPRVFEQLADGGAAMAESMSANALRLVREKLDASRAMDALVQLCDAAEKRECIARGGKRSTAGPAAPLGRVLGITGALDAIAALRLTNPLRAAREKGLIQDFRAIEASLDDLVADETQYDIVLVQRTVPQHVYEGLADLGFPYLLDVDDNLLARASYRSGTSPDFALRDGLCHASVLTTPAPRLVQLLEKYSGLSLARWAQIVPNALPYPALPDAPPPVQPSQIIWIQSDIAALVTSRDPVVRAVEDFSRKHALPIVLVGRNVLDCPRFTHQVVMGQIDFEANLRLLETAPTSIGVAPLETATDEETLDFIAGKSDLKILLFAGYTHPAVVSASPPYLESPLCDTAFVVGNSYREWLEALEYQYQFGWKTVAAHARRIQSERHIDRVAEESWVPALRAAAAPAPISGAALFKAIRAFEDRRRREAGEPSRYLERDENVRLRAEIAEYRNSLSWRITAPLRAIAAPLMRRPRE
jgi:glycosyltransferase involved in cell wall biosynthesis